jgi:hypothetical protein
MKSSFKDRVDKRGLYANIAAKRRRIEAQKARGAKKVELMRKPGAEGAPSGDDFKKSAKTAKGQKRQDPKGNPAGYYDKEGCKTCAGGKKPCKCGKKDMVGRKTSYADGYGKKCDSIAADFESVLIRSDKKCGRSGIPEKAKCSKTTAAGRRSTKKRSFNPGLELAKGFAATALISGAVGGVNYAASRKQFGERMVQKIKKVKAKGNESLVASLKSAKNLMADKKLRAFRGREAMLEGQAKQTVMQGMQTRNLARAYAREGIANLKATVPNSPARQRKANRKPITAGLARR